MIGLEKQTSKRVQISSCNWEAVAAPLSAPPSIPQPLEHPKEPIAGTAVKLAAGRGMSPK